MKKLAYTFFSLLVMVGLANASDVSFFENGFGGKANITRNGENLSIKYNLSNINTSAFGNLSPDQQSFLGEISNMQMEMLLNCKQQKVKVLNSNFNTLSGAINNANESDWIMLNDPTDISKAKSLCSQF